MDNHQYQLFREQWLSSALFSFRSPGRWSFVFLLKAVLCWLSFMSFSMVYNLAVFTLIVVPIKGQWLSRLRDILIWPLMIALFYYDSHLPPIESLINNLEQLAQFSLGYWLELAERYISMAMIAWLVVAWIAFLYFKNIFRMGSLALLAIIFTGVYSHVSEPAGPTVALKPIAEKSQTGTRAESPEMFINDFYQRQDEWLVNAPKVNAEASDAFDILLVNICSISWEDIKAVGLENHSVFSKFDIILDNYNSVSSYSGPSALRILQASCGQKPHQQIYQPSRQCLLADDLTRLGFKPELFMNHDGEFDNFKSSLLNSGGIKTYKDIQRSLSPTMIAFDGAAIFDDKQVIDGWLAQKEQDQARFGFYNSLTLHDGNRKLNSNQTSLQSYKERALLMFEQIAALIDQAERQERKLLLIVVPEHGAGLKGDGVQLAGLREIPTYPLTHVPVMLKLIGAEYSNSKPIRVEKQTNQNAISSLIMNVLAQQPFSGGEYQPQALVNSIPETEWVSENKDIRFMLWQDKHVLKLKGQNWVEVRD
jgi:cellulose synthase operon protein YhjU